jgi:hypothetical protein
MSEQTSHGTREHITWIAVRNGQSFTGFRSEADARADYEHRAKTLHKGETLHLERRVHVEMWIIHTDVIAETKKDPS